MLVGAIRFGQFASFVIDVMMSLAWPINAICPMHAGVKPLRRVRRCNLHRQHVTHLVKIGQRVFFVGEIATLPAPICPGTSKPVVDLLG